MKRWSVLPVLVAAFLGAILPAQAAGEVPDYSNSPRSEVPVEFTWNLDVIYPGDEAWRESFDEVEAKLPMLRKKSAAWTESARSAMEFLRFMDEIEKEFLLLSKYAYLTSVSEISNPHSVSMSGEVRALGVEIELVGSGLREQILSLGEDGFADFLATEPGLEDYAFSFEEVFRGRAHTLTEAEQRIADLTNLFTDAPTKVFNLLNNAEIPNPVITVADGTEVTLNRSAYNQLMESTVREDRLLASRTFWTNRGAFANSLAATLDAGCKQHLFDARVRGFDSSLEAALFDDRIESAVYHNAIRQIRSRADLLQRYLTLKKEMLGLEVLSIEDVSVNAVATVERRYTWDDAVEILSQALEPLGREYNDVVASAFADRWIDRYPNKDKQSGAFSSPVFGVHPFIKMNYQGQYSEVGTLAHELGHAVQQHLSATHQPYALHRVPSYVSEVASIFNEHLLNRHLLETDPNPRFRLSLLDEYMKRVKTVVFFSAILSELEVRMHEHVETGGTITGAFMNETVLELLRHYYGHDAGVCEVPEYVEAMWSVYPHLFMNFYLLSYSNGFIASMAASEMLFEDEAYRDAYLKYLKAGGSAHALDLLKIAEIDLATEQPYDLAFQSIERVLDEMEVLAAEIGSPETTRGR